MTRWSVRILFASALVLAFAGGDWNGRRSLPPAPVCTDPGVVRRAFGASAGDTITFKPSGEVEVLGRDHWASYNGMQMVWPHEMAVVFSGGLPAEGPDEDRQWLCSHSMTYFLSSRLCSIDFVGTSPVHRGAHAAETLDLSGYGEQQIVKDLQLGRP